MPRMAVENVPSKECSEGGQAHGHAPARHGAEATGHRPRKYCSIIGLPKRFYRREPALEGEAPGHGDEDGGTRPCHRQCNSRSEEQRVDEQIHCHTACPNDTELT